MKQFEKLFTLMGVDGMKHFILSAALTALLAIVLPWWMAAAGTLAVGLGKEAYDRITGRGMAEWKDVVCNLAGIIIGAI